MSKGLCDYCGALAELRPYGVGGASICFACGMANIEETERQFEQAILAVGEPIVVIGDESGPRPYWTTTLPQPSPDLT
jgi:hypothetical protein